MSPRPIVLVGLMGSGKTSVAKSLARELGRPMRDNDQDLQAEHGQSAAQQAARAGAGVLHDREARQVREALADPRAPVIAAAASVVEDPAVRAALRPAYVVWLDAPPEVLASRMAVGDHRPHYDPDLVKMLAEQHARRAAWYREVADLIVDVAEPTPDEIARTIAAALAATGTAGVGEAAGGTAG